MKNSIGIKKPVPTIITTVFLVAALAFALVVRFAYSVQAEAESWYPEQSTLN